MQAVRRPRWLLRSRIRARQLAADLPTHLSTAWAGLTFVAALAAGYLLLLWGGRHG